MSLNGTACIVGAYEHPTRLAENLSVVRLHADVAKGALDDAGLTKNDIDGYFCAGDAPGLGTTTMAEYLGLKLRHVDSTECGGSAPILHVAHAAAAIANSRIDSAHFCPPFCSSPWAGFAIPVIRLPFCGYLDPIKCDCFATPCSFQMDNLSVCLFRQQLPAVSPCRR